MDSLLLYAGSLLIIVWGAAHIFPTRNVVAGFGDLSLDNRRLLTMEWVAEGMVLIFIGLLVLMMVATQGPDGSAEQLVYRLAAAMLLIMAAWTAVTGARTSILPIKICPVIKTTVALFFFAATL